MTAMTSLNTTHHVLRVSPRGFADEVTHYRVPAGQVAEADAEYAELEDETPGARAYWIADPAAWLAAHPDTAIDWSDR